MPSIFTQNQIILFQGDSITDAGRDFYDYHSLGNGYASIAASLISADEPDRKLQFLNKGVSGDSTTDLLERWDRDCIALNPDWVSILIGINNTWRFFDFGEATSTDQYVNHYRRLIDTLLAKVDVKLVLCEPFLLHITKEIGKWRTDLDPKIQAVHDLAKEYDTILVEFDKHFQSAAKSTDPFYWAQDGVHPTNAGFGLMARVWMDAVIKKRSNE